MCRRLWKWRDSESNRGHHDFQSCALPTELSRQLTARQRPLPARARGFAPRRARRAASRRRHRSTLPVRPPAAGARQASAATFLASGRWRVATRSCSATTSSPAALRRRVVSADLHRPAVQHRAGGRPGERCRRAADETATASAFRAGASARAAGGVLLRGLFDDYLAFLEPRLRARAPAARRQRHALLPHRLPRGPLLQASARRALRPRVLSQRDHLGL